MRQLNDSDVYTPLDGNPTRAMVTKINERIQECFKKEILMKKRGIILWRRRMHGRGDFTYYRRYTKRGVRGDLSRLGVVHQQRKI